MRARYAVFLSLLFYSSGALAASPEYSAAAIINGQSFTLTSGETVRLAAIETPTSSEPLSDEAKTALAAFMTGKKLTVESVIDGHDRLNRLLGQVYADGQWVQGAMLRAGLAMVYSFADTPPEILSKMLVEERAAREARRGIWGTTYYRVIAPSEADEFIDRFKLVEGKVVSLHEYHGNIYINFFAQWRGHFAVFISHKYAAAFTDLQLLAGKTIRVRGWIHYHNAPMIGLTHAGQIEVE
jgi:micrococcal nuclease